MSVSAGLIRLAGFLVLALGGVCLGAEGIEAITRPSEDRTLSFVSPGEIATMAIEDERSGKIIKPILAEGDAVKVGQVLARQDTKVEQAEAEQIKATAEDRIRVDAQEAKLKQTEVDLRKFEDALKRGAATPLEVEHARLEVTIAKLSLDLANFERAQAKRKYEEKVLRIGRMTLRSPIDGVIREIYRRPGEAVNALEKVIRVVKIDPLWIDVPVPKAQARKLRKGSSAFVDFDPPKDGETGGAPDPVKRVKGEIIYVAVEEDAASLTRTIRVRVPNLSHRPAGEHVMVYFTGEGAPANTKTATERGTPSKGGPTKE
jgi:RND family efflux transporter MFP subunit